MTQTLGGLPYELVEKIIDHLDSHDDLLAFALLCSYTKNMVLPNRLDYHTLVTSVFDVDLWVYLAERPRLGRYVRKLVLYHERGGPGVGTTRTYRIPSGLRHPLHDSMFTYTSSTSSFEGALQTMSRVGEVVLRYFRPARGPDVDIVPPPGEARTLATIFSHLISLETISISGPIEDQELRESPINDPEHALWKVSGVKSLKIDLWSRALALTHLGVPILTGFFTMVPLLSRLEVLHLSRSIVEDALAMPSFAQCRFPLLKRLSLAVWTLLPEVEPHLVAFFLAHPTVESLSWLSRSDGHFIPRDTFPSLQHLVVSWSFDFSVGFLAGRERHSVHLQSLAGFNLNESTLLLLHVIEPSTLRVLRLQHLQSLKILRAVSKMFPGITELDLPEGGVEEPDSSVPGRVRRMWSKTSSQTPSVDDVMKLFPHLTIVRGAAQATLPSELDAWHPTVYKALHTIRTRYPQLKVVNRWRL